MKMIKIQSNDKISRILIGERLENLSRLIPAGQAVVITDTNVSHYYGSKFIDAEIITIGTEEKVKTLKTVEEIYTRLLELKADRSTFIVGIGGGVVCDIAGFVASTYMRGLRFGFVPSTLLAQVDASMGGKNGVNFKGYKNMIGVFNQPEFVICDPRLLTTLPHREILSGLGEIVKHAAIADSGMFTYLEDNYTKALALDLPVIQKLVSDSIIIKSSIVNRDEQEKGERRKLNFGHTFGHAFEKTTGISHGEAVSAGMLIACRLAARKGLLTRQAVRRFKTLLTLLHLPADIKGETAALLDAIHKDKKREGSKIHFVLLDAIGSSVVVEMPIKELEAEIAYIL